MVSRKTDMIRYPGGKTKLKKQITQRLLDMRGSEDLQYREPFFGGGSIGLNLLPSLNNVWINDRDPGISCLWTSVINHPLLLKRLIVNFEPNVDSFYNFKDQLMKISCWTEDIVKVGFMKLAIHQLSYSGLGMMSGGPLGGKDQKSKYKIDCRWSPGHLCKKIDQIHEQFSQTRIHGQCCTNLDFNGLIKNEDRQSLLYLDPPYYTEGNKLYACGFSLMDHIDLSKLLRKTKHRWVLSYDDCEYTRRLYNWATIEEIEVKYTIKNSRAKKELLIYERT